MTKRADEEDHPLPRIPPAEAPGELHERLVGKRVQPEGGDVVLIREVVPTLHRAPTQRWRYRLCVWHRDETERTFNSFQHAASAGEQRANERRARLLYREDDAYSVLNDYRT
jgi:signal peptidase I